MHSRELRKSSSREANVKEVIYRSPCQLTSIDVLEGPPNADGLRLQASTIVFALFFG